MKLLRKTKKEFYNNLNVKYITENKLFWKTVKAIEKYQNHPSIKEIRENIDTTNNFSFDSINPECISKIINNLCTSKATQQGDISTKIVKDNKDLFHILYLQAFTILRIRTFLQTS